MSDDATDYKQKWENTYGQVYAKGRRHWRPELATPRAFARFMQSKWAPPAGARILEAGCGDGLNAIRLAQDGYDVTGVDISEAAISRAREVAAENGVDVQFLCLDLAHDELPSSCGYDLWIDIKTLHCLWEDEDRQSYLISVRTALRERGILFLNGGLALADVREHFPAVFEALEPAIQAQAHTLDRELPKDKREGIRCETLDWYCQELTQAGLKVREARREASIETGWGAIVIAQQRAPAV